MTNLPSLSPLIEKIEAAEEGSVSLDTAICAELALEEYACDVTTSIDAIVGLIEKEFPGWGRGYYSGPGQSWGQLYPPDSSCDSHKSVIERSNAEALALCAAFLRAVQAKREAEG